MFRCVSHVSMRVVCFLTRPAWRMLQPVAWRKFRCLVHVALRDACCFAWRMLSFAAHVACVAMLHCVPWRVFFLRVACCACSVMLRVAVCFARCAALRVSLSVTTALRVPCLLSCMTHFACRMLRVTCYIRRNTCRMLNCTSYVAHVMFCAARCVARSIIVVAPGARFVGRRMLHCVSYHVLMFSCAARVAHVPIRCHVWRKFRFWLHVALRGP